MDLCSVLYISQSCIDFPSKAYMIGDIARSSKAWNRSVGITGALAFTESYFAQYIEGPEKPVGELVVKLLRDDRHGNIDIVKVESVSKRRFDDWSLAFSGPDVFTDAYLRPLLERDLHDEAATNLLVENWLQVLHELASATQTHI